MRGEDNNAYCWMLAMIATIEILYLIDVFMK